MSTMTPQSLPEHPIAKPRAFIQTLPPFSAMTASSFLGRLFTRFCNVAVGICAHSATRALLREGSKYSAYQS